MELLYDNLPATYMDIYSLKPPSMELPAPHRARKSWHRFWITMALVRRLRWTGSTKNRRVGISGSFLGVSFEAIKVYSAANPFPEQVRCVTSGLLLGVHSIARYRAELV